MLFSITSSQNAPMKSSGKILKISQLREGRGPQELFTVETWGMSCCGVHILKQLSYVSLTLEEWEKFFEWWETKKEEDWKDMGDQWNPGEFYFLLSDDGKEGKQNTLLALENVKKVDTFMNHAHGPSRLHLYRYSRQKDFK